MRHFRVKLVSVFKRDKFMQKYKYKSLKTYSSTEWLANALKKYRKVFLRQNVDYIYFEMALYNLQFEKEDWTAEFSISCYKKEKGDIKKICDLNFEREVSSDTDVFYLREGWGNSKKGVFWKKGEYFWEAKVNGELIGVKTFFIEQLEIDFDEIPEGLLELNKLSLTEGFYSDGLSNKKEYKVFDSKNTRYIYVNIEFENMYEFDVDWKGEIFLIFHTESRELKGVASKLVNVRKDDDIFEVSLGWGADEVGSWFEGAYTVDMMIFDRHIASVKFDVGEEFVEGTPLVFFPEDLSPVDLSMKNVDDNVSLEELMAKLDSLIGLEGIKTQIRNHAKYIQFIKLRKDKGFKEENDIDIHMVFMGNPGTGKTTVAEMMGMIYKKMGVLSKGHVHSVDRVDLIGEYIGQTAPKVKQAIKDAKGGVLFIDEAYSLSRENNDSKDFGREVIEILVKEMSDGDGDLVVIAAGYPKEMEYFIKSNPGLKSRFKLFYNFPDYLPQDLSKIAKIAMEKKEIVLTEDAQKKIDDIIVKAYRDRDKTFGNARYVYDLIEKAKINMALRVMEMENRHELEADVLRTVTLEDVEKIEKEKIKSIPKIPIDEVLLQEAFDELNSLIGLEKVKQEIIETVGVVRYHIETGKDVLNNFFLHTVFIGNPGTGKTTVARILTKIYKALGILERGHMVETDRQGLVAGFIGQTAIKTAEKIDEAMGGVLFIDEAYSLSAGGIGADYGNEAIQTLLKRMEDKRGEFFVFVAGYPENMERFLKTNPGLQSRFDKILKFEDYSTQQLFDIANSMFTEKGLSLSENASGVLLEYLDDITRKKDKYFGNARKVRKIVIEIVENQNIRISTLAKNKRKDSEINQILPEDITKVMDDTKVIFDKKSIGFRAKGEN